MLTVNAPMTDLLVYPVRVRPHLGWDPCPGSPEGCRTLAATLDGTAAELGELAALVDGLRLDTGGWQGASAEAYEQGVLGFPRHLGLTAAGFTEAAGVLRSWADEMETFQRRADEIDVELGRARHVLATARGVTLPSGYDTALVDDALREVVHVEARAERLAEEYLAAARAHGTGLDAVGNGVWGATLWERLRAGADDVGDRLGATALGQAAREHSGLLASVEETGRTLGDVLTVGGAAATLVPGGQAVGGALVAAGRAAAAASTAAAVGLALGGHGRWVDVVTPALPGRAFARRPSPHPSGSRRGAGTARHRRHDGFDPREHRSQELRWAQLRERGDVSDWPLQDDAAAQRWAGADPWDLPDGVAYLRARPLTQDG